MNQNINSFAWCFETLGFKFTKEFKSCRLVMSDCRSIYVVIATVLFVLFKASYLSAADTPSIKTAPLSFGLAPDGGESVDVQIPEFAILIK